MRLIKGSLTVEIVEMLWQYGQLPYSSLELLGCDYEWAKDCIQKLIKEEYIGVVKDVNLKSLYLKPTGQKAWLAYCERIGVPVNLANKPHIVYNPDKARRVERVNEARLLADKAGLLERYLTGPEAKSLLEQDAARQSDNIKYSRFAGILFTAAGGLLIFHFGKGNLHLNVSGEKNAKAAAGKLYKKFSGKCLTTRFTMLVLGSTTDTALSILNYSDMLADKSEVQRGHMKTRHFNLAEYTKVFGDILFFPVMPEAPDMLRILASSGASSLYDCMQRFHREGTYPVNLLECRLHKWSIYRKRIPDNQPVEFFCYGWQIPLISEYFVKSLDLKDVVCRRVPMELAMQIVSETNKA